MPAEVNQAATQLGTEAQSTTPPSTAHALWQILTHFDTTKLFAPRALRNAIGVVLPLVAGFALHMPRAGLVVASGALNVSYSDGSDSYAGRSRRMLASSVICAIAVFAGAISGQHQFVAIVLATTWAFIAGMSYALGGAAPDLGAISLVTLLIYAAQTLTPRQAAASGVLALGGGLLQTALSIALWPVRRYEPERRALAKFYLELANRAAAPLSPTSSPLASIHSEQAQEALSGLGRDPGSDSLRYRGLLDQGERIRLTLMMLLRLRLRMQRESQTYPAIDVISGYLEQCSQILRRIAESLSASTPKPSGEIDLQTLHRLAQFSGLLREQGPAAIPSFLAAVTRDALFQMDALNGQLRAALDLSKNDAIIDKSADSQTSVRLTGLENARARIETLRANLNLQSPIFRHALRLAALVALGDLVGRSVSWRRTYWLPMTIALVLKPDFAATFTRGLLRIAGTIIGLLLATGLFHLFHPNVASEVILVFIFVFVLRWLGPANYGIFCVVVSGLIVLLLAINGVSPAEVIWARGINTMAGGILALLAYWLWPTWERTRVSERFAQMLDAYRDYVRALSHAAPDHGFTTPQLEPSRRAARMARATLENSIDRLSTEPGTTRGQMDQLNAAMASSHRFIHAAMALDAIVSQGSTLSTAPGWEMFSSQAEKTVSLLASALRGARTMPRDFPDLRAEHRLLVKERFSTAGPFDAINVEADRMTNSVNTLTEQIMQWVRSPEFARLHKMNLDAPAQGIEKLAR
jgi:uncharacterized membrane protein YccC